MLFADRICKQYYYLWQHSRSRRDPVLLAVAGCFRLLFMLCYAHELNSDIGTISARTQPVQVESAAAAAGAGAGAAGEGAGAGAEDVEMGTDAATEAEAGAARPDFPALTAREMGGGKDDFRRIRCPPHRLTPLRNTWENIVTPTVEHMKLQIRYIHTSTFRLLLSGGGGGV